MNVSDVAVAYDGASVTDDATTNISSQWVEYTADGLADGTSHHLDVTVVDRAGNERDESLTFSVADSVGGSPSPGGSSPGDSSPPADDTSPDDAPQGDDTAPVVDVERRRPLRRRGYRNKNGFGRSESTSRPTGPRPRVTCRSAVSTSWRTPTSRYG